MMVWGFISFHSSLNTTTEAPELAGGSRIQIRISCGQHTQWTQLQSPAMGAKMPPGEAAWASHMLKNTL